MAKFIDKKERVYDLKLTNYGNHLLSIGKFKPVYYSFMDDNIIYDGEYAGIIEEQNEIIKRIQSESQYLESLVSFEDAENQHTTNITTDDAANIIEIDYFEADVNGIKIEPRADGYILTSMIGDAFLDADTQKAPGWKLVALQGVVSSSSPEDEKNKIKIPQVHIDVNYFKNIEEFNPTERMTSQNFRDAITTTSPFLDNRVIKLVREDLIVYGDELNTEILTENYDIEVFEILKDQYPASCNGCSKRDVFKRKYFSNSKTGIKGANMTLQADTMSDGLTAVKYEKKTPLIARGQSSLETKDTVSYYFDLLVDQQINKELSCKLSKQFNKDSYYIDIDFDCENLNTIEPVDVDIYGKVTEPEICL